MRQLGIFICFILFLAACSSKNKVPKDILPKQQMEDVLWDLLRAGEFLEVYKLPKDSSNNKTAIAQGWYDEVFRLHKTDRPTFQKSYTWYQRHPAVMKEVLDSISTKQLPDNRPPGQAAVDSAKLKKDSAQKKTDSVQVKPDSVQKPLIRTGKRPDDTLTFKMNTAPIRHDRKKKFLPLPGQDKLNTDSIRRARAKKLPD